MTGPDPGRTGYRSGTVAILGRPNAGKSTFLNAVLDRKLAIVSPKPQTTRERLLGIYEDDVCQIGFLDTPGLHVPRHAVSEHMLDEAEEALRNADVALYLLDASRGLTDEDRLAAERLKSFPGRKLIAVNKSDTADGPALAALESLARDVFGDVTVTPMQALHGQGVREVLRAIRELLPEGPPLYDGDSLTDKTLRQLASELIREQCFLKLREELPYGVAVEIRSFEEKDPPQPVVILADLFVEKENQKGIVIGGGGRMLKAIGTAARGEIEKLVGRKVFLELQVKVLLNWRKDPQALRRFGYGKTKE